MDTSLLCGLSLLATLTVGADPSYTQVGSRLVQPYTGQMGSVHASSISGDGLTIAFGGFSANITGLVFLYSKSGDTLRGNSTHRWICSSLGFGAAVALDLLGDVLVVGSPFDASGMGYVYIFEKTGGTWSQTAQFRTNDAASTTYFGKSVAVSDDGNMMVAGSSTTDNIGAVSIWILFSITEICGHFDVVVKYIHVYTYILPVVVHVFLLLVYLGGVCARRGEGRWMDLGGAVRVCVWERVIVFMSACESVVQSKRTPCLHSLTSVYQLAGGGAHLTCFCVYLDASELYGNSKKNH